MRFICYGINQRKRGKNRPSAILVIKAFMPAGATAKERAQLITVEDSPKSSTRVHMCVCVCE